jgi:hypothetical protein
VSSTFSFPLLPCFRCLRVSSLRLSSELFGNLFGGEAFVDLIGEISMIKDFMGQAEVMMYALFRLSFLFVTSLAEQVSFCCLFLGRTKNEPRWRGR